MPLHEHRFSHIIHVRHLLRNIFVRKTACQKYFFLKSFPKQTLRLWISKILIWIWSEESTQSVDFTDPWSVFGFALKNENPFLDSEIRIWIYPPKKRTSSSTDKETHNHRNPQPRIQNPRLPWISLHALTFCREENTKSLSVRYNALGHGKTQEW